MLLLGLDEGGYLLKALSSVRSTELEQALLLLPFGSARALLQRLLPLLPSAAPIELLARCVLFLLRVHHKQVVGAAALLPLLHEVNAALSARLATEHSRIGYNLAAMRFMAHGFEQRAEGKLFAEALQEKRRADGEGKDSVGELRRQTVAKARGAKKARKK